MSRREDFDDFTRSVIASETMRRERAERERDALLQAAGAFLAELPGGAAAQRRGGGTCARLADIAWHLSADLPLPQAKSS